MNSLNDDFKTDISVEKVDLSFLGTVGLKGVKILDHKKDTLIYVGKLSTSILNFRKILNNNLNLDDISLSDAKVYMKTYKGEKDDNMSVFIDKFDDGKPSDSLNRFILKTKNIYLQNLDYKFIDENDRDPLQFSASEVGGCAQNFVLDGSNVSMNVRGMYFTDNRGVKVKNFTSDFLYTKQKMEFLKTTLATDNYSKIQGDLVFNYKREDFSKFLDKVHLKATLKNSLISAKDLKKFYSEFGGNDKFKFRGNLSGTLNDLAIRNFSLYSKYGMKAKGNLKFRNSFSRNRGFKFQGDFANVTSNYDQLHKLLPNKIDESLKKDFDKVGDFSAKGNIVLTPEHMDAVLTLKTDMGGTISNLRLTDISDINKAKYGGEIQFVDLDLGKLTNDPLFGKVSLKANVDGGGLSINNLSSVLKGKIDKLEFNGYAYENLYVNGEFENRKFDGYLKVNDQNMKMTFEGLADFSSKVHKFDFNADIETINLKKTKLFTRDSISQVRGKIKLDAVGNTIDDIVGKVAFQDFSYLNQKQEYKFKKFEVESKIRDSLRTINVHSEDIIHGTLKGRFAFKEVLPIAQNALWSTYSNYEPVAVKPNQFLKFDFIIYSQIVDIFFPEINIEKNAKIKGKIDGDRKTVRLTAKSPKVKAYNVALDSLELRIDNKNFLYHTHLTAGKVATKYYDVSRLNLINRTKNDTLYFKSAFFGGKKETEKYNMDFFYTFNQEKKSVLGLQKSIINVNGNDWVVNPNEDKDNKITYDLTTEKFEFFPFLATSGDQKIEFNGNLTNKTKELKINLKDIGVENVMPEVENLTLEGILNGELNIIEKNGLILPTGDIQINDLIVNDFSQGILKAKIKGDNSYNKFDVDFSIRDYEFDNVKAVGKLDFSKKEPNLDLKVNLKKYELNGFSDFGDEAISGIRGLLSGDFTVKGKMLNPDFDGWLNFEDAGLTFPYLNIDYDIVKNTRVKLKNQSFFMENVVMQDTKHETQGFLSGNIRHKNFSDWYLDLNINSKNLLVLDTRESEEEPFYGTGFLNGGAKITGKTSALNINVEGKTEKETRFVIPLSDVTIANNYKLIKFKEKEAIQIANNEIEKIEGLNLFIDLEVTKDAIAEVVIDKVNKSELQGKTEGNLFIEIDTKGDFKMNGDLVIEEGIYNFRYTGIPKKFEVEKGGTISWNGDPFKADLDLVAVYQARANPAQLLDNIISNRKIPVNLYTKITGELFDSKQEFDIKIPSADSSVASELEFRFENDKNSKMLNFASLLLGNTFYNDEATGNFASNVATSTASDVLSNILSDIINSDDGKLQLNVGYTQADQTDVEELIYDDQVDFSVQGQLSERVIFNGKLGVPVGASNIQSSVIGEAKLEVLLNDEGTFRWNIFNKPNNIQYSIQEEGYTQGTGLSYQVHFNSLSDLAKKVGLKDSEKTNKKNDTVNQNLIKFTQKKKVNN